MESQRSFDPDPADGPSGIATGILGAVILAMLLGYAVFALLQGEPLPMVVGAPIILAGTAFRLARRAVRTVAPGHRQLLARILRHLVIPVPDLRDDDLPPAGPAAGSPPADR